MRFLARAFTGLIIIAASVAVIGFGVSRYMEASEGAEVARPKRPAPERIYTVRDLVLEPVTVSPVTAAYGTIEAARVLELRAAQPGRVVDLITGFRDGAEVTRGETLMRIDPATTESREADAIAALADARSRESDARQGAELAEAELDSALRQVNLRNAALQRQRQLLQRGIASRAAVETEELAVAAAQQTVITRRQALTSARNSIEQTRLAVERAELSVSDARRDLADTVVTAPFTGILSETTATLGRLVSASEALGQLIDPRGLEVAFRLTDAQFARILDSDGRILPLKAEVTLALGERKIVTDAILERSASSVEAEGGRMIYAALSWREGLPFRPGDFVSVAIEEPPLTNVAQVPARAATEDGRMFVIGEDGRLSETQVRILRRMQDSLVIADAPFGARMVAELRPQLGEGVKVQNAAEARAAADRERQARESRGGRSGAPRGAGEAAPSGERKAAEGGEQPAQKQDGNS